MECRIKQIGPNVQQYVSMGHDEIVNVSTYVLHMVGKLNLQAF